MDDAHLFWEVVDDLHCDVCLQPNLSDEDECDDCRSCSSCGSLVCRCMELFGFVPHLTDELVMDDGSRVLRPVRADDYEFGGESDG